MTVVAVAMYLLIRASLWSVRSGTRSSGGVGEAAKTYLFESLSGIQSLKLAGSQVMREASYAIA